MAKPETIHDAIDHVDKLIGGSEANLEYVTLAVSDVERLMDAAIWGDS